MCARHMISSIGHPTELLESHPLFWPNQHHLQIKGTTAPACTEAKVGQ